VLVDRLYIPRIFLLWQSDCDGGPVSDEDGLPICPTVERSEGEQEELLEMWLFGHELYPAPGQQLFTAQQARELNTMFAVLDGDGGAWEGSDDLTRTALRLLEAIGSVPLTGAVLAQRAGCAYDTARRLLPQLMRLELVRKVRAGYVRV
jgi:hypothetical protein